MTHPKMTPSEGVTVWAESVTGFYFFFFFGPCCAACRILVPSPGTEPISPCSERWQSYALDHHGILAAVLVNSPGSASLARHPIGMLGLWPLPSHNAMMPPFPSPIFPSREGFHGVWLHHLPPYSSPSMSHVLPSQPRGHNGTSSHAE